MSLPTNVPPIVLLSIPPGHTLDVCERSSVSGVHFPSCFSLSTAYVFLEVCLLGDARQSLSSVQPPLYLVISPCCATLVVHSVCILVCVFVRLM